MARIVKVSVVDSTKAIEQKGFKKVLIFDPAVDLPYATIEDTSGAPTGSLLLKNVEAFFGNGGGTVDVFGKVCADGDALKEALTTAAEHHDFYGLVIAAERTKQGEFYAAAQEWADGNEKLAILEVNGAIADVKNSLPITSSGDIIPSDRVVYFANKDQNHAGIAGGVAGKCFPMDEGSINWGNQAVSVAPSGYKLSEEAELLKEHINYITKVGGLVVTQFARTIGGGNADVTRSKDFLAARLSEGLTALLVNSPKIPFTTIGMAMISGTMSLVGIQAQAMGMLDEFHVIVPDVADIPVNDKANRVLRGVKFVAKLAGAIDTIELELDVTL